MVTRNKYVIFHFYFLSSLKIPLTFKSFIILNLHHSTAPTMEYSDGFRFSCHSHSQIDSIITERRSKRELSGLVEVNVCRVLLGE